MLDGDRSAMNELGEWQATDVLHRAGLHPLWRASIFAACPAAVARLKEEMIKMAERYDPQVGDKSSITFPTSWKKQSESSWQ